jgi:hypothetical protein
MAARCILFLKSGLDYQWPEPPSSVGFQLCYGFAWYGIPAGAAVLICWLPLLFYGVRDVEFMHPIGVLSILWLAWSIWYLRVGRLRTFETPEWKAWRAVGDYDVWPFFRREEFYEARRTPHFFRGATTTADSAP